MWWSAGMLITLKQNLNSVAIDGLVIKGKMESPGVHQVMVIPQ